MTLRSQRPDVLINGATDRNGARSVVINIKTNNMIIKRHGKIVMEEVGQKPKTNYLPALGIILFIAGMLIVGTLDYKVLVM